MEVVQRSQARGSGPPGNYLLLKRADHVRVTHILVYAQPAATPQRVCGVDLLTAAIAMYAALMLLAAAWSRGWLLWAWVRLRPFCWP